MKKSNTHGKAVATGGVVAMEPVSTMAADSTDDQRWAATFICNYRRSFRRKARPPQVNPRPSLHKSLAVAHERTSTATSMSSWGRTNESAPTPGAPKLHPVRPSGGELGRLNGSPEASSPLGSRAHTGRVYHPNSSACPNATMCIAGQLSTKVASLCARAGWRSFSSAFASI